MPLDQEVSNEDAVTRYRKAYSDDNDGCKPIIRGESLAILTAAQVIAERIAAVTKTLGDLVETLHDRGFNPNYGPKVEAEPQPSQPWRGVWPEPPFDGAPLIGIAN